MANNLIKHVVQIIITLLLLLTMSFARPRLAYWKYLMGLGQQYWSRKQYRRMQRQERMNREIAKEIVSNAKYVKTNYPTLTNESIKESFNKLWDDMDGDDVPMKHAKFNPYDIEANMARMRKDLGYEDEPVKVGRMPNSLKPSKVGRNKLTYLMDYLT